MQVFDSYFTAGLHCVYVCIIVFIAKEKYEYDNFTFGAGSDNFALARSRSLTLTLDECTIAKVKKRNITIHVIVFIVRQCRPPNKQYTANKQFYNDVLHLDFL